MLGNQSSFHHLPEILTVAAGDDRFFVGFPEGHRIALPAAALVQHQGVHEVQSFFILRHPLRDFNPGDFLVQPQIKEMHQVPAVPLLNGGRADEQRRPLPGGQYFIEKFAVAHTGREIAFPGFAFGTFIAVDGLPRTQRHT